MNYHQWLYRTRRLMTEVEAAMSEMAGHIATDDALPNLFYNPSENAKSIVNNVPELRRRLRESFYRMIDRFPEYEVNRMLKHEATKYVFSTSGSKAASRSWLRPWRPIATLRSVISGERSIGTA